MFKVIREPQRRHSTSPDNRIIVDWEQGRASVPLSYLESIDMAGFTSEGQSPWADETEAFVISPELKGLLQLDDGECESIRVAFLAAQRDHVSPKWIEPADIRQERNGVVIEIDPAPEELELSLRQTIVGVIGEARTALLFKKIQSTLDWEFGGFGRARRVVEVTILPDDSLSIRESLRTPVEQLPPQITVAERNVRGRLEWKARQFRLERLPDSISSLVAIHESEPPGQ